MNDSPIPLAYLVYREVLSSVFASQVLTPLEEHRGMARVSLGLLTPIGHLVRSEYRPTLQRIRDRCRKSRIDLGWLPSPPTRTPWLWSDRLLLRQWLARQFPGDEPCLIRCRGSEMTCLALDAVRGWPHARVVYDCRGAEVIETTQRFGVDTQPRDQWPVDIRHRVDRMAALERRAAVESAGVTCVSQAMVQSLLTRYPFLPPDKFTVVPCCPHVESFSRAAADRDAVRTEFGLQDKFVVSYLGSLVWYQLPEQSLRVFRLIQSMRPDAHFFAITTEPEKMRALTEQAGLKPEDVTIRSLPPQDVPRVLVAADLGLMLRDSTETNRVASPVKLGEYLAAGIPVVITPQLGDYSEAVREHHLGVEIDLSETDPQTSHRLRELVSQPVAESRSLRTRCINYADEELSWSGVLPRLTKWYEKLLNRG